MQIPYRDEKSQSWERNQDRPQPFIRIRTGSWWHRVFVWDGEFGIEFSLSLSKSNVGSDIQAEGESATELAKTLSGDALASSQMAGRFRRCSWPDTEFMRMSSGNPRKGDETKARRLWQFSLASLSEDCRLRHFLGFRPFWCPSCELKAEN